MTDNLTSKTSGDYWRSGCECNRAGLCYRCRAADEIDRLTAENKALREALLGAVDCIREWHNAGLNPGERSHMWDIYWRNAPEMKAIREALEGVKP